MKLHSERTAAVCRRLQDTLAEQGPAALRDDRAAQGHLEDCDECFRMLEALTALDAGFDAMPPVDAPDELVESLLRHPELRAEPAGPTARSRARAALRLLFGPGRPRLRAAMAFAMLAVISMSVFLNGQFQRGAEPYSYDELHGVLPARQQAEGTGRRIAGKADGGGDFNVSPGAIEQERKKLQAVGYLSGERGKLEQVQEMEQAPASDFEVQLALPGPQTVVTDYRGDTLFPRPLVVDPAPEEPTATAPRANEPALRDAKDDQDLAFGDADGDDRPFWVGTETDITFRGGSPRIESTVSGPFDGDDDARARVRDRLRERLKNLPRGLQDAEDEPAVEGEEAPEDAKSIDLSASNAYLHSTLEEAPAGDLDRELARRFLAERDATDAASRPATGYWTNTYVPGDPVMRYLQARLAAGDRSLFGNQPPRLHDGARRTTQPFDPPADAALAIQLHADRTATLGETRMLVQVGLAGTARRGGKRPAMNVALVLDLRDDVPPEAGTSLVALAGAFAEAQDFGDRFRLFTAGRGTGELVAPKGTSFEGRERNLRRGQAVVALSTLLAADPAGTTLELYEAVRLAIETVGRGDDPDAPLGSSAVIVATSRPLGKETEMLAAMAHESAVAGIPISVVGVGATVNLTELDSLALSGHGSRRLLLEAAGAPGMVDRELAAAGRAVARALRLSLSLAPGVRLIDVVGARRHNDVRAQRVRESERAIDLRLARSLSIEADRGDDEAGIQIVIPTFYAGDHHVVLIDVVVPGPGPIVDVTARFKDLVRLENAVARAQLTVARGEGGRGPLERNVLKNLLAHRLRGVLENAGWSVADGDREAAAKLLAGHRSLLAGLRLELAGLDRDPDLGRDLAMLDEYASLFDGRWLEDPARRRYLADSLRYAARLKVLPAPVALAGTG